MQLVNQASALWTDSQREVMAAFADCLVPHLDGAAAAGVIAALPQTATDRQRELVAQFATEGFLDKPELMDRLAHQATASLSQATLGQIGLLLHILSTRAGTFALTGYMTAFPKLDRTARESILRGWLSSPLLMMRKGAAGLKGLILITFYRWNQLAWEAVGYEDRPADDWKLDAEKTKHLDRGHYEYKFENDKIAQHSSEVDVVVETDVLIIGSGSGGGVAGQYLSQRGVRVLVVDKGTYLRPTEIKGREDQGYPLLYEGEGLMPTEDGSINVLAGSTFGGGTTVNWSASLKPRHWSREAWATKYGVPYFRSPAYTEDLNAVCSRMGCGTTAIRHNTANSLMALGAQRAGQPVEAVPQNSGGHTHYCGKCMLGCVSGQKQGGQTTWLRDIAESGNGAFMINTNVERVLFDDKTKRKAIGALVTCDGRRVTIRANKGVIVAGGSINTPAILLRSPELKYNKQIGRNLHLHPTTVVTGYYDFPIKPWEGSLLTMVSNACELVDPEGWGSKIEVIASSPSIHAGFTTYQGPEAHKKAMLKYAHSFTTIIITRDREGGRVFVDGDGDARMDYTISKHDQASMLQGVLRALDIHMMAGASEITTVQTGVLPFRPSLKQASHPVVGECLPETTSIPSTSTPVEAIPRCLNDPDYVAWRKTVEKAGVAPSYVTTGSAHQMGSCRMAGTPKLGALDPEGRVWGTKNLWVADSSVLPEASGVNPMVSTMGAARGIARNIALELGVEAVKPSTSGPLTNETRPRL